MISRIWLLSGIPRSGSSLCCRLAGDLPNTVALSEPIRDTTLADIESRRAACSHVQNFGLRSRAQTFVQGQALSVHVNGRLQDDRVTAGTFGVGLRPPLGRLGIIKIRKRLTGRYTMLIKHNALFAALLPELASKMRFIALVRNPLAVLASWQTVDLPVYRGRIPAGERFDGDLRRSLYRERNVLRRQIAVLNWFFSRFLAHVQSGYIIRYEDLIESGGRALFNLLDCADMPEISLENRNINPLYRVAKINLLLRNLLRAGGAWREFYTDADCRQVADKIKATV